MRKYMKNLFTKPRRMPKQIMIYATIAILLTLTGFSLFRGTQTTVALTLDGKEQIVKTHAPTIGALLEEMDVTIGDNDYLNHKMDKRLEDDIKLVWIPATKVVIEVDGKREEKWTTASTVNELLTEEKIELTDQDKISPALTEKIKANMDISIDKAFQVTLVDSGKSEQIWSTSTTVADFLKQKGVQLTKLDKVEPGIDEHVTTDNTDVTITRVEKVTDVVEEPVSYATITKKDSSMMKGKEKVVSQGKEGVLRKRYDIIIENGKEISRKLISEKTVQAKQDKVVAVGTKTLVAQVSRGSSSVKGAKEFYVTATAYTGSCNGCSGRTSTGLNLKANPDAKVIAVDPNVIPLGTKVYVEGYGYAVAADTGGAVIGNKIDVFMSSKNLAYRWGVKRVKIKILN